MTSKFQFPIRRMLLVTAVLGAILYLMGRTFWCSCGSPIPWSWEVYSKHNSQHLIDWYTFSHILHGFIFYWLTGLAAPKSSKVNRLIMAMLAESAWEVAENSPIIIERYRAATISLDYYGDSILNSLSDLWSCVLGFVLASKLKVRSSILFFIATELILLAFIRDNLTLNVLMLVWPIDAIKAWQSSGM